MADDAGTYRTAKIKEHLMSPARRCLAFFLLALLTAVPAHAQNTAEPAVALQGMDVVSYFKDGGPVKGQSAHRADFDGARYLFSSAQNRAAFVADPDRYLPQFSGLCATGVSLTIGVLYGAIAGFLGGKVDALLMRVVDILYALPFTLFVILLTVWLGRELWLLFAAIGAVEWLTMARIVRGQVASLKRMEFVEAAHALGLRKRRIILRHMIPNVLGPVIVYTTLTVPAVMLLEAFLSFLGLGVQPPMSSWGSMIKTGADHMEEYWWMLVFPAGVFSTTLFCLNFLGDGLRDALDVRASKD